MPSPRKPPHPLDVAVGARVRAVRISRGFSQATLAERLGLTFQQVQKYERGANRISASKLVQIARSLGINPAKFFQGLGSDESDDFDFSLFTTPNAMEMVVAYARLPSREQRALLRLAQDLAGLPRTG